MKKIISIVLVLTVLCMSTIGVYAQGADTTAKIHYNGKYITFTNKPVTTAGKVLVPLKELGGKIGIPVTYDARSKCYTAKKGTTSAVVNTTKKTMSIVKNGKTTTVNLGADLKVLKADIMVPLKTVADSFDIQNSFDAKSNTAIMLDMSYFDNLFKTKAPVFYQYMTAKYTKPASGELTGKYSGSIYIEDYAAAQSQTIDVKGDMSLNGKFKDNTYNVGGQAKLSGIEEILGTDALNNIDFQIIVDKDAVYIKTNLFELLGVELGDKWGRIFIKDLGLDGISSVEDLKKYEDPQKGYNLTEILTGTEEALTVDSFKNLNDVFTAFLSLVDADNFKIVKTNATTLTCTWTVTKNDIVKLSIETLLKNAGKDLEKANITMEDIKELKDVLAKSDFNLSAKMVITNNILTHSEINMSLQYKSEDVGLIKVSFKGSTDLTNVNSSAIRINVPTEAQVIDLSELTSQ